MITDLSWDFTNLWGSSPLSLSLSEPASRVIVGVVDVAFKGISIPGCGECMLKKSFVADVEDTNS
jgi:hypothetical protein